MWEVPVYYCNDALMSIQLMISVAAAVDLVAVVDGGIIDFVAAVTIVALVAVLAAGVAPKGRLYQTIHASRQALPTNTRVGLFHLFVCLHCRLETHTLDSNCCRCCSSVLALVTLIYCSSLLMDVASFLLTITN